MPAITINDRAYMPTIYKPDNRRTDMPATRIVLNAQVKASVIAEYQVVY